MTLLDLDGDVVVRLAMGSHARFRTWHLHGVAESAATSGARPLFLSRSDA